MTRTQFDALNCYEFHKVIYHYHTKSRKVLGTANKTPDGNILLSLEGEKKLRLVSYKSVSIIK